jgi:flavodoxin
MRGLVLFRSFFGNTKQVADYMGSNISELGHEVEVQDLRQRLPEIGDIDFIIVGAPTRMAGVTGKAKNVLKQLSKSNYTKPVAIFDLFGPIPSDPKEFEKGKRWLYPGAAGKMEKEATKLGLNVYSEILRCEVTGIEGPLGEGELERASMFVSDFISWIMKNASS